MTDAKKDDTKGPWGNLLVTVHEAKDLRDTQMIGTQDPYCKLKLSKKELRSKVHHHGGKVGKWEDVLEFNLKSRPDELIMNLSIWNQNTLSDAHIGSTPLTVADLIKNPYTKKWIGIFHESKDAGQVCISSTWQPGVIVTVNEAKNLHDTQLIGKMDPYVIITIGKDKDKNKFKSKIAHERGVNPKWVDEHHTFCKPLPGKNDDKKTFDPEFSFDVWDLNPVKDDWIGGVKIKWSEIDKWRGKGKAFFPLTRDAGKKPAGELALTVVDWKFA